MGRIHSAPEALLFQGITYSDEQVLQEVLSSLENEQGPVLAAAGPHDFSARTDYYEKEMGRNLRKLYLLFSQRMTVEDSWQYKLQSQALEAAFTEAGKRRVNIDPGLLTLYNFTLFSSKGFSHRIYLSLGIYSELTLLRKGGRWEKLPWTYPDYLDSTVLALLDRGREELLGKKPRPDADTILPSL